METLLNEEVLTMGIPDDELGVSLIMSYFTKELYTYPALSSIREIIANALDANALVNSEVLGHFNKVKVDVDIDDKQFGEGFYSVVIEDKGPGMNRDMLNQVFCKFTSSTKRDYSSNYSNIAHGGWGIGGKGVMSLLYKHNNYALIETSAYASYQDEYPTSTTYRYEINYDIGLGVAQLPVVSSYINKEGNTGTKLTIPVHEQDITEVVLLIKTLWVTNKHLIEEPVNIQENWDVIYWTDRLRGIPNLDYNVHREAIYVGYSDIAWYPSTINDLRIAIQVGSILYSYYTKDNIIQQILATDPELKRCLREGLKGTILLKFEVAEIDIPINRETITLSQETILNIASKLKRAYLAITENIPVGYYLELESNINKQPNWINLGPDQGYTDNLNLYFEKEITTLCLLDKDNNKRKVKIKSTNPITLHATNIVANENILFSYAGVKEPTIAIYSPIDNTYHKVETKSELLEFTIINNWASTNIPTRVNKHYFSINASTSWSINPILNLSSCGSTNTILSKVGINNSSIMNYKSTRELPSIHLDSNNYLPHISFIGSSIYLIQLFNKIYVESITQRDYVLYGLYTLFVKHKKVLVNKDSSIKNYKYVYSYAIPEKKQITTRKARDKEALINTYIRSKSKLFTKLIINKGEITKVTYDNNLTKEDLLGIDALVYDSSDLDELLDTYKELKSDLVILAYDSVIDLSNLCKYIETKSIKELAYLEYRKSSISCLNSILVTNHNNFDLFNKDTYICTRLKDSINTFTGLFLEDVSRDLELHRYVYNATQCYYQTSEVKVLKDLVIERYLDKNKHLLDENLVNALCKLDILYSSSAVFSIYACTAAWINHYPDLLVEYENIKEREYVKDNIHVDYLFNRTINNVENLEDIVNAVCLLNREIVI